MESLKNKLDSQPSHELEDYGWPQIVILVGIVLFGCYLIGSCQPIAELIVR